MFSKCHKVSRPKNVFSSRVFFPNKVFVPEKKSIKNGGQAEPLRKLMILHVIQWETHSVSKSVSKRHQSTKKIKGLDFLTLNDLERLRMPKNDFEQLRMI